MSIKLTTKELKQSDNFIYLGGVISADSSCDKDVVRRIGIASGVVRNLDDIWKSKEITADTKVKLYQSLVQSALLHCVLAAAQCIVIGPSCLFVGGWACYYNNLKLRTSILTKLGL